MRPRKPSLRLGLSYYSPETGPRPITGGVRYASAKSSDGYLIEAAIPFRVPDFRPQPGDLYMLVDLFPRSGGP